MQLLIISPNSKKLYQSVSHISAIEPNIWAGLLANSVRNICDVAIYDMEAEPPSETDDIIQYVKNINPDMILFVVTGQNPNASTASMSGAIESAEIIKCNFQQISIAFIGPHINALPHKVLEHWFIDIAFINEGVIALKNLMLNNCIPVGIKGIWYKENGQLKINPPEQIVSQDRLEIDLPGVAYDLMPDLSKYRTSQWHTNFIGDTSPFASIYTSLGCFSQCSFCMINSINRTSNDLQLSAADFNTFRYWTPEFTIKQLKYLSDKGIKHLKIADEMFVYRPKHFLRLCDLIIEEDLKFNIWCYSRIDTCKPHYLDKLKEAGVNWLALGLESSSQQIRQEIDKGRFKEVDIRDVVKSIREAGINVGANYIVGLGHDNWDTMQQTMNLAMELNTENMNVYCATALPGSPLYLERLNSGKTLPQKYSEYGFLSYDHIPSDTEHLSGKEVMEFRDYFFQTYFTNPNYLNMIYNKFGQKAIDNIKEMTKIKLKRKLLGD